MSSTTVNPLISGAPVSNAAPDVHEPPADEVSDLQQTGQDPDTSSFVASLQPTVLVPDHVVLQEAFGRDVVRQWLDSLIYSATQDKTKGPNAFREKLRLLDIFENKLPDILKFVKKEDIIEALGPPMNSFEVPLQLEKIVRYFSAQVLVDKLGHGNVLLMVKHGPLKDAEYFLKVLDEFRERGFEELFGAREFLRLFIMFADLPDALDALDEGTLSDLRKISGPKLVKYAEAGLFEPRVVHEIYDSVACRTRGLELTMDIVAAAAFNDKPGLSVLLQNAGFKADAAAEIAEFVGESKHLQAKRSLALKFVDLEPDSLDVPTVFYFLRGSSGHFAFHWISEYGRLKKYAGVCGVTVDDWKWLLRMNIEDRMRYSAMYTLGALDAQKVFEGVLFSTRFLYDNFGYGMYVGRDRPIARFPLNDDFALDLKPGEYEAMNGFQMEVVRTDGTTVAVLGFQESAEAIEVVRFQGGELSEGQWKRLREEFRTFSGGAHPLPWLALAFGRHLLGRAKSFGKELRWIAGERIAFGYPRLEEESPRVKNVEEGRLFWKRFKEGEFDEEIAAYEKLKAEYEASGGVPAKEDCLFPADNTQDCLARQRLFIEMLKRGPHVEKMYDWTAQNLGFRRRNGMPWWRYTKDASKFGRELLSRVPDMGRFVRSLEALDEGLSRPALADLKTEHGVISELSVDRTWTPDKNPFLLHFSPPAGLSLAAISARYLSPK